ncbi:MAG: AsnC family transcriptional regulator [Candidatus Solibacter sp.]|nr:AsnC family transcriptional regulator [Candidatus Solibacter sp.]
MPIGKKPPAARLDELDWRILAELQAGARLSYSELGRRIALSTPAAAERVRRLEDWGVIRGYSAIVDPERVGLAVGAFIRIRLAGPETLARKLTSALAGMPEVLECHRCTGDESFILKVRVASVGQLESLIDKLTRFGATSTSLILSSPVERRTIQPPEPVHSTMKPSISTNEP